MLRTRADFFVAVAFVLAAGSERVRASATPTPPTMPAAFTAGFSGQFFGEACLHTGFLYYNSALKLLRTDWMFGPSPPCLQGNGFTAKADVNDATAKALFNYHVLANASGFTCEQLPLANWWTPDYLAQGTFLGTMEVSVFNRTVLTDVYNTTGQFLAGYVLTYLPAAGESARSSSAPPSSGGEPGTRAGPSPPSSFSPVRMEVWQGPFENYFMDFFSFVPLDPAALPRSMFQLFPNLPCPPIAR